MVLVEPPPKRAKVGDHPNFTLLCQESQDEEAEAEDTRLDIILDELKRYRKLKHLERSDESCPLKFYETQKFVLPHLTRIASLVFCTTASSVPSECVFSTAGELINKKRTRLQPALAEDLLFLHKNNLE